MRITRKNRIQRLLLEIDSFSGHEDDFGFKRIHSKRLDAITPRYSQDITWLRENNFLAVDDFFIPNIKPKGYKLLGFPFEVPASEIAENCPYTALLASVTLDQSKLTTEARNTPQARRWASGTLLPATRSRYRLYNQLTHTPKVVRRGLIVDGEPAAEVDIKTAQPFFLAAISEDEQLMERVLETDFYTFFEMTRAKAKEYWGRLVHAKNYDKTRKTNTNFRSWWDNPSKHKGKFASEFPVATDYIQQNHRHLKAGIDNEALIDKLFKMESGVIVDDVLGIFLEIGKPGGSIHDGILCKPSDAEEVKQMIENSCKARFGHTPEVKISSVLEHKK